MKFKAGFGALVASLLSFSGCGESGPKLVGVTGTVTLNGKPFEGASVVFAPDPSNKEGRAATDVTGPEGNYKAMTGGRSGMVPGKYKVTVIKVKSNTAFTHEEFKDDPLMAQLSKGPVDPSLAAKSKKANPDETKGDFDREIPPPGGIQDFDVKAASPK